jgi:TPR repeat protein
MYAQGHGVPQDYAEAVRWWRAAADRGDDTSQYNLGLMYAKGHGIPETMSEHTCGSTFNLAAAQHDYEAAVEGRTKVERKMTPAQIGEAQRLAQEWKPKPGGMPGPSRCKGGNSFDSAPSPSWKSDRSRAIVKS